MSNCFCHFNGYEVKDAKARTDIVNINKDIDGVNEDITDINNDISDINTNIEGINKSVNDLDVKTLTNIKSVEENISNVNNEVNLQNFITYDLAATSYIQGSCVIDNLLYVYQETNFPNGDLLVFDITTMQYVRTIQNLKLYHANDMVAIDNKIYAASTKSEDGTSTNKTICVVDLADNSVSELKPFSDISYLQIWGLTKISDTELLCGLTSNTELGSITLETDAFYIYNIQTGEITELEVSNPKNMKFDTIYARQSMEYNNGKLYIMTSLHNTLIECVIDETTLKFNKLYNLPNMDHLGILIEEYESISLINNSNFADNTMIITTKLNCIDSSEFIMKSYIVNLDSNVPYFLKQIVPKGYGYDYRQLIYVNNESTSLYEDGTVDYPFKTIERAMQVTNYNHKVYNSFGDIYISGGNNYSLPIIYEQGTHIAINNGSSANVNLHLSKITSSRVYIAGGTNGITLTGDNNKIEIGNSTVRFKNVAFNCFLVVKNFSDVRTQECTSVYTSTGKIISVSDFSTYMNGITSYITTGTYVAECMAGSVFHYNTTHIATAKIEKVSECTLVEMTN